MVYSNCWLSPDWKSFVENRLIQSTVYFTTLILQILLKVKFSQLKFENRCFHIIRLVKTEYHHDQTHPWTGQPLSTIDHVLNILILSPLSSTDLVEMTLSTTSLFLNCPCPELDISTTDIVLNWLCSQLCLSSLCPQVTIPQLTYYRLTLSSTGHIFNLLT